MATYVCLNCGKETPSENLKRKVICRYCGSKLLGKKRNIVSKLKAR